ncbi:alpha/beta hydrolase [Thaumasiovibrio subtropicus]|uniref:alpha/beta hydrolase n=1 Tax=Thaumasiovibrio subtropicus TaxID=1891207 RepID=UPI000B34C464|nr:alpha/beta fold hydrolase [Thaumasiovibrio subtropicus]
MYRKLLPVLGLLFALLSGFAVATEARQIHLKIDAPSLANSVVENDLQQEIYLYLPPSYHTSEQRYPVVYYLHGYGGSVNEAKTFADNFLDKKIANKQAVEMIVVGINGRNRFGGSFFYNSPITGHWEDFVTEDVLNYIDSHYRTYSDNTHRGIIGFSMGGYAALNIAFRHPDKFQYLFSLSPGLFDSNGLDKAFAQWKRSGWFNFLDGYAATFAPDLNAEGDPWQVWDGESQQVRERWEQGFGNVEGKVAEYLKQPQKLAAIHLEYGGYDRFKWIPEGTRYMAEVLTANEVDVTLHDHEGSHGLGPTQAEHIVTFFSDAFAE